MRCQGLNEADASKQLSQIRDHLLQAALDCRDLRGPKGESPEAAVVRILQLCKMLTGGMWDLEERLKPMEAMKRELLDLKNQLRHSNTRKLDLERTLDAFKTDESIQRTQHDRKLDQLNRDIAKLKSEKEELSRTHESTLNGERINFRRDLSRLSDNHEDDLRQMRESAAVEEYRHEQVIQALQSEWTELLKIRQAGFEQRLESERFEARQRLKREQQEHESEIAEMQEEVDEWKEKEEVQKLEARQRLETEREEHQSEIAEMKRELEEWKQEAEIEKARIQKEAKVKERKREQQFQADTMQLRADIEEYKGALVAREHFKGFTDPELSTRFKRLAGQVEEFSRIRWDNRREEGWPFPEHVLSQLHPENTRKLKQQIVQNCLWVLLHAHVFRTPFRIMGEEGKDADKEWLNVYAARGSPYEFLSLCIVTEREQGNRRRSVRQELPPKQRKGDMTPQSPSLKISSAAIRA